MTLKGAKIGFGVTGSHCTLEEVLPEMKKLKDAGAEVVPFITPTVLKTDTKFGASEKWQKEIKKATGCEPVSTIVEAEPFGPKTPLDLMVVAPLTGSSLSKFANALTDSAVLMAAKATLRNQKPVVVAVSTNDAMAMNGENLMKLMNAQNIFIVPLGQDAPDVKPTSLVARMEAIPATVEEALRGRQIQPVFIEKFRD
ncbi:dipicolinate synthase subunit B [Salsuginibacillus halophilus]|uniref:Dipicolinate synthase subunit B n=1 Tax=Salsuginibacillus halophilus TaxID=517424 RepID=A0A2P8HYB3_9BACI|nr:dipicolinate synthase subunit B [Salsuginibacillus halophilus]PSL51242.1 dipicolinate synthase subunit B [Salsuginibacillus halophilus]